MALALLAARLVRRATTTASSSFPLTTLARCWARRSSSRSATAVLPPGGLAADASASSLITARRCLASHAAAASSSSETCENLLELIDDEISFAAGLITEGDAGDPPKMFPFEVTRSNRGAAILKREFAGEIIKGVVDIDYFSRWEPVVWSDGEFEEVPYPRMDQMVITVEKPDGSIIKFNCKFFMDGKASEEKHRLKMVVQKVRLLNCGHYGSEYVYKGSSRSAKDDEYWREAQQDELQKALRSYLGVRGIKVEWDYWSWLCEYAESLEDFDLFWWQNLKAFIEK